MAIIQPTFQTLTFFLLKSKMCLANENKTSTEVPVSGDGTIKRVSLSWGVREAESQRVRESPEFP